MDLSKRSFALGRPSKFLALPTLMALTAALGGCGGSSNNLPDPGTTQTVTSCTSTSSVTCVSSQFIVDAPVVGLGYQCGIVNGVTDNTGTVSCPDNSTATFFIQGANNGKKITLGNYLILSNRDISRKATNDLVSITPVDLVSTARDANSLTDAAAAGAVNIAQLLETLRSSTSQYNPDEPTTRLILDTKTLTAINLLSADIPAPDVISGAYVSKIQPVLDNLKLTLLSTDNTNERLMQGLKSLQAGSYYTPIFSVTIPGGASNNVGTVAQSSTSTTDAALLSLYNLIDRSGYTIGQGVEWNGSILSDPAGGATTTANLQTKKDAQWTKLIWTGTKTATTTPAVNIPSFFNPISNYMTDNFIWQPQAIKMDDSGNFIPQDTTTLGNAIFSDGRLLGGTFVVGDQTLWQNVTNASTSTAAPAKELASWTQSINAASTYKGTLTQFKTRSVNTFLDPKVMKTAANVGTGKPAIFPLHAVLTFTKGTCTNNCTLGSQGITILANGNIISDMAQDCRPVDPVTLKNDNGVQQYRIGLLGAAFQGITNVSDLFISPVLMLSGPQFGALDGIQIGTITFTNQAVKMNVTSAALGSINISDNTSTTKSDGTVVTGEQSTGPAVYVNAYDVWNQQKQNSTQPTADTIVTNRSIGSVTARVTSCNVAPIGK